MDYFNVKNRSASMVVYRIPENNVRREFQPGETKKISKEELDNLAFQPGGRELMLSFLQIQSTDALRDLNIPTEPEYYMNEQQIADLIVKGSLDAFLDCLDFAPTGVMDLIKKFAVQIPMTDTTKIDALKEKTGFDVDSALRHVEEEKIAEKPSTGINISGAAPTRRVQPAAQEGTARRTTPKYKVVETKSE